MYGAVVDHGLNVSDAAGRAVYGVAAGHSKQIRLLEDESVSRCLSAQGQAAGVAHTRWRNRVQTARRALREIAQPKTRRRRVSRERIPALSIATTHTQARYVLPKVLREFATRYPKSTSFCIKAIRFRSRTTARGDVDIGLRPKHSPIIRARNAACYEWNRVVLVPKRHPLANMQPLTLEALANFRS